MNWFRIIAVIVAAGIVGSLMDWLFGGILWHEKYMAYPEVWRNTQNKSAESKAILWATLLGFLTSGIFIILCAWLGLHGVTVFLFAFAAWLMIPLPQLIVQGLFIKLHPLITVAHSMGWLAKLLVAAVCAMFL